MLRRSFVPPVQVRLLRDLTRYRANLVAVRSAEKNRVEKLLEDAQGQAVGGGQRHLRGVGAGDACGVDRRPA
jgi:transposase